MTLSHCPRCGTTPLAVHERGDWTCPACRSVWDVFGRSKKVNGKGGILRVVGGETILFERGIFSPPVACSFLLVGWRVAWEVLRGRYWMRVEVMWSHPDTRNPWGV